MTDCITCGLCPITLLITYTQKHTEVFYQTVKNDQYQQQKQYDKDVRSSSSSLCLCFCVWFLSYIDWSIDWSIEKCKIRKKNFWIPVKLICWLVLKLIPASLKTSNEHDDRNGRSNGDPKSTTTTTSHIGNDK